MRRKMRRCVGRALVDTVFGTPRSGGHLAPRTRWCRPSSTARGVRYRRTREQRESLWGLRSGNYERRGGRYQQWRNRVHHMRGGLPRWGKQRVSSMHRGKDQRSRRRLERVRDSLRVLGEWVRQ